MFDFGTLNSGARPAAHINKDGYIVGKAGRYLIVGTSQLDGHGFIQGKSGEMVDLNYLIPTNSTRTITDCVDANTNGAVLISGFVNAISHDFLLTPITKL